MNSRVAETEKSDDDHKNTSVPTTDTFEPTRPTHKKNGPSPKRRAVLLTA
jgi:hypothetical protein